MAGNASVNTNLNVQKVVTEGGLTISWNNLSVWVKKRRDTNVWQRSEWETQRILNNVSGCVESGSLMAIMGASGAGKTTLLATLSKRMKIGETKGDILLNGRPVTTNFMNKMSGFVPQVDLTIESLTVLEHMEFMARLKMDRHAVSTMRRARVDALLRDLGIRKCQHTSLASLSGGERKRLSLAVQLITDPPLLFCDEPTTGLDSFNASAVIELMKRLAESGKLIICTIHQPASGIFDMFSRVLLLAGGRVAFHGDVMGVTRHFTSLGLICPATYNKAEFYVAQLAIHPGKEEESARKINRLCTAFENSPYGQSVVGQLTSYKGGRESILVQTNGCNESTESGQNYFPKYISTLKVHRVTQIYWLTWRSMIDIYRNYSDHLLKFIVFLLIALLISTPFSNIALDQNGIQNLQGLMYLIITETIFTYSYGVLHTFPHEMPVLLREVGNDLYHPGPYYVSKMLVLLPQTIVESFFYTVIVFCVARLNGGFLGFLVFCIPVIMCAITATAYGCVVSAMFESLPMATLLSVPIDLIAIIFSGLYMQLGSLPIYLEWLPYLSQFYYGIEAVSIQQWEQIEKIDCSQDPSLPCISSGQGVLLKYGYDSSHFYLDIWGLIAIYFIAHIFGFLAFYRRSKKQPIY